MEYVLSEAHSTVAGKKLQVEGTNKVRERRTGAGRNVQSVKWLQCEHEGLHSIPELG